MGMTVCPYTCFIFLFIVSLFFLLPRFSPLGSYLTQPHISLHCSQALRPVFLCLLHGSPIPHYPLRSDLPSCPSDYGSRL